MLLLQASLYFIAGMPLYFTAYWGAKWNSKDTYETRKFFSIGMKVLIYEHILYLVVMILVTIGAFSETVAYASKYNEQGTIDPYSAIF